MTNPLVPGATVRGPFTADRNNSIVTLVDKHMIVCQIEDGLACCMYTGTDDGTFRGLPGYVEVPQNINSFSGWKLSGKFYCNAASFCIVPVELLEVEGRVTNQFFSALMARAASSSVAARRKVNKYDAKALQHVTGYERRLKQAA